MVPVGGVCGGGLEIDAGVVFLPQLGTGAVAGFVVGGGDGYVVVGGLGHVMIVVFVLIRAISASDLLGQVRAVVLEGLVAVACGGGGAEIALAVVGVGLGGLFHQRDVVKTASIDVAVIGCGDGDGGNRLTPLFRDDGAGSILPIGVVTVKGNIMIVRLQAGIRIRNLCNETEKPLVLAVIPLHVGCRGTVGSGVSLGPAG